MRSVVLWHFMIEKILSKLTYALDLHRYKAIITINKLKSFVCKYCQIIRPGGVSTFSLVIKCNSLVPRLIAVIVALVLQEVLARSLTEKCLKFGNYDMLNKAASLTQH